MERHPFPAFIPAKIVCLILGSFPGKEQSRGGLTDEAWFYGAPLNQFWRILAKACDREFKTKKDKQRLFEEAGIGISDIFRAVIRTSGSNLDENLEIKEYNWEVIETVLKKHHPPGFVPAVLWKRNLKSGFRVIRRWMCCLRLHQGILS